MIKTQASILVIDDDPAVLTSAKLFLKQKFSFVKTLPSPENMYQVLKDVKVDLILLDMNYSKGESDGKEGLDIIEKITREFPGVEILPITAYGEINLAVEAMKRGVRDFVTKPWSNEKLHATIMNILNLQEASKQIELLRDTNQQLKFDAGIPDGDLIGRSRAFKQIIETTRKVAPTEANVLILGENGTGKEVIAKAIHQQSERGDRGFVKVDLGSLPESLFESELFGYVKGAFTDAKENREGKFELANGGTLFLDEIGNINARQQSKLLTALQNRTITRLGANQTVELDVRLICATNINLHESANSGKFRQDLLYRINTIEIELPGLKDRTDDIPLLVEHFLKIYKSKYRKRYLKVSKEGMKVLQEYNWPGNVRELKNVVERAVILSDQKMLSANDFHLTNERSEEFLDSLNLREMEKSLILRALEKNKGNITHAARDLGIDRLALYRRLEKYGL